LIQVEASAQEQLRKNENASVGPGCRFVLRKHCGFLETENDRKSKGLFPNCIDIFISTVKIKVCSNHATNYFQNFNYKQGVLITKTGIPQFLATMAVLTMTRGLVYVYAGGANPDP
jgi:hypothetical protein